MIWRFPKFHYTGSLRISERCDSYNMRTPFKLKRHPIKTNIQPNKFLQAKDIALIAKIIPSPNFNEKLTCYATKNLYTIKLSSI